MDFYDNLSALESEAMRRARKISAAEQQAAAHFHATRQPPHGGRHSETFSDPPVPPADVPHGGLGSLLGGKMFRSNMLASPDFGLIAALFFILQSEGSDPLLMLALIYILM